MKWSFVLTTAMLIGCATTTTDPAALAQQHQRTVARAQELGYEVVTDDGQTRFCATSVQTGSHIIPPCVSENQWMLRHPDTGTGNMSGSGVVESGRSSFEGTLGY